jgi:outer membrane protein assembly factor BamB
MSKKLTPPSRLGVGIALTTCWFANCTCDDTGVTPAPASIEVEPLILDFGPVPIDVTVRGTETIRSVGESSLRLLSLQVRGASAFELAEGPQNLELAPGQSDVATIQATPRELGSQQGRLTIESDEGGDAPVEVLLRILGIEKPPCDDGNLCTRNWFDTDTATCKTEFADGDPCQAADKCIINAVCAQGVCLGQSKVCDDQNACTRDLCRQIDGECVHLEAEGICDDANPCTEDVCLANGCRNEPVANGSPCEDGDLCTTGDICFLGECVGRGTGEGEACDDGDSCTINDLCVAGVCTGNSIINATTEGERIFESPLTEWPLAFLHRREVSLREDGVFVGLDHLALTDPAPGLTHVIFTLAQCGGSPYEFAYRPPDSLVQVFAVRREMQVQENHALRIVVGVRQLPSNGFTPQTTSYLLDPDGNVMSSRIRVEGGETGRSLLPDGSHIYGVVFPVTEGAPVPETPFISNLSVVRESVNARVLWKHDRTFEQWPYWAEFLGVAGPRVLFWSEGRFGALDFNTGQQVWSRPSQYIAKEMALSTALNLGITRVGQVLPRSQLLAVEVIEGEEVFLFPETEDRTYRPRTDPVISADGRVFVLMQRSEIVNPGDLNSDVPLSLEWVELSQDGSVVATTPLPYYFPVGWGPSRHEDHDDPYPTVADDGVAYVGYGDQFWAINPGGGLRWTLTSTIANAFTGTVPLLRADGVLLISEGSRKIIGVRTNGGRMSEQGWASFRHDGRRTNFTP